MLRTICRSSSVAVVFVLVLLTSVSWSSQEEGKKSAVSPEATKVAGAFAPESRHVESEEADMPPAEVPGQLVLSATAETGPRLFTSWPLIVTVCLWRKALLPDAQDVLSVVDPITVTARQGSWREALVVEVLDASGEPVGWPLNPRRQPETSVSLGVDDAVTAQWWLEPAVTKLLVPGTYTLSVSFRADAVEGLPRFQGSDRFSLEVEKEPEPLDERMATAKQLQLADFSLFKGDAKTASSLVGQVLSREPENIKALRLQAKCLMGEGKTMDAANVLEKALHVHYERFPDADPPLGLLHERSEVIKNLDLKMVQ
jgi:hypothetical protein